MTEQSIFGKRQAAARKVMESAEIDGVLFSSLENIRYLCGFTGSDGAFFLSREEGFFLTDSRYWTQSEEEVKSSKIVHYKKKMDGIVSLILELESKKIGFEAASLPYASYKFLSEKIPKESVLVPLDRELKNLRAVKDRRELESIRAAIDIASKGLSHLRSILKEGLSENQAAQEMEFFMKRAGAETTGFDTIIASGKRAALPHGKASAKRIERQDFILIDFGSCFEGYHSDQTRTLVCGKPSSEQEKIYGIVKDAHDRAIERVRPGIPIHEVDAAARDHIRNLGYGEYFGHGTGHGIGLAVHEDPGVNWEDKTVVEEGMVFTIEPGIYIPDWGGVRIEDMVLVTSQGAEILTPLPTDLQVV